MALTWYQRKTGLRPSRVARSDITRGLAFLWAGGEPYERLGGGLPSTFDATVTSSALGQGIQCATGRRNLEWSRQFITTSDGFGIGDVTMLVIAAPSVGGGAVQHMFSQKNDAAGFPYAQVALLANADAGAAYSSGSLCFFTYASAPSAVTAPGAIDGAPHVFVGVRLGSGGHAVYSDGKQLAISSLSVRNILQASRYTAVGSRGNGTTESMSGQATIAAAWNRALRDEEIADLGSPDAVLRLFAPKRIWVPVGVGGGTTYNFSASGSVALSGAAPLIRRRVFTPSGIVTFSGTSPFTFTGPISYTFNTSGSVAFSGTAVLRRGRVFLPSGIVTFSGTSPFSSGASTSYTFNTSGSFTLSGTLRMARGRVLLPSGSVSFSGTALWQKGWVYPASGQVQFSGTANMYFTSGLASGLVDRMLKGLGK